MENNQGSNYTLLYFIIAFLFSWVAWSPVVLRSLGIIDLDLPQTPLLLLGTFGPFVAAMALTYFERGMAGIKELFKRALMFRFPWSIWLFILVVPPLNAFLAYYISGGREYNFNPLEIAPMFILMFFLGGSFAEEFGWRGFALPRMQPRFGRIAAALILGALWAVWHLPIFWMKGTSQYVTPFWIFFINVVAASVAYTWIFNRTNGSILSALMLHTMENITVVMFAPPTEGFDPSTPYAAIGYSAIAILLLLFGGGWKAEDNALNAN